MRPVRPRALGLALGLAAGLVVAACSAEARPLPELRYYAIADT